MYVMKAAAAVRPSVSEYIPYSTPAATMRGVMCEGWEDDTEPDRDLSDR
jgi:hypothetical protein